MTDADVNSGAQESNSKQLDKLAQNTDAEATNSIIKIAKESQDNSVKVQAIRILSEREGSDVTIGIYGIARDYSSERDLDVRLEAIKALSVRTDKSVINWIGNLLPTSYNRESNIVLETIQTLSTIISSHQDPKEKHAAANMIKDIALQVHDSAIVIPTLNILSQYKLERQGDGKDIIPNLLAEIGSHRSLDLDAKERALEILSVRGGDEENISRIKKIVYSVPKGHGLVKDVDQLLKLRDHFTGAADTPTSQSVVTNAIGIAVEDHIQNTGYVLQEIGSGELSTDDLSNLQTRIEKIGAFSENAVMSAALGLYATTAAGMSQVNNARAAQQTAAAAFTA